MIHSLLDINMAEIKPVLTNLPIDSNLKQLKKSHRLHKMTSYSSFHALLLTLYDYFKRNLLNEDNNINNTMISLIIHAGCERSDHPHYRVMNLFSCEACLPSTWITKVCYWIKSGIFHILDIDWCFKGGGGTIKTNVIAKYFGGEFKLLLYEK